MDRSWHLLLTKPRGEEEAVSNLMDQEYEVYLPRISVKKLLRGRYKQVTEAMFPRYLFINLAAGVDSWGPIRSTPGVSGLVRFRMGHATAPDSLIEALRQREDESGLIPQQPHSLSKGDNVCIVDGPFKNIEAIFHAVSGEERVILLMYIAGKEAKVRTSIHSLSPAS